MKTEISNFCASCSESLRTLPGALQKAALQLELGGASLRRPLANLNDLRARLQSLADKLRSEVAYLLIFGPLKSGKSTLMNALSSAYVSEVTSLPGYPCLVFVQHADEEHYSITRYNGRESVFPNGTALKAVMETAHEDLVDEIRKAEQRGDPFDPQTTFPETIRRVDVRMPVPGLKESALALVDTPGLYSRMNFGYDVVTREFRDGAACAVFVVKTDNLFLEQVFAEFNQLLLLFSRIFIVVNIDTTKRDLTPQGTLRPSAESEHPERVVDAFKTLSMAGPLRAAYEKGRVRIHAVDLLTAASAQLSGTQSNAVQARAFTAFQQDLLEYLNSADYTREFIRDSLRQAQTLCGEMQGTLASPEMKTLRERQAALGAEISALDARIAATERLSQTDWMALFQRLRTDHLAGTEDSVAARIAQLRSELREGFGRWMAGKDSLAALPHLYWNPAITEVARSLAEEARARLERLAGAAHCGMDVPSATLADLDAAGFSPVACSRQALASMRWDDDLPPYKIALKSDTLPVRKKFVDWLLFRSRATVRQRVFGADGNKEVFPVEKERRLGVESREELEKQRDAEVRVRFPVMPVAFATKLAFTFSTGTCERILSELRSLGDSLKAQRNARQPLFQTQSEILAAADELQVQTEQVAREIELLAQQEHTALGIPPPIPPELTVESDPGLLPAAAMLPFLGP